MARTVHLTWDAPDPGGDQRDGYHVYRVDDAQNVTLIGSPTAESFDDTNAADGTEYKYYVKAFGPRGESAATNEVVVDVPFPVINPPKNLVATVL